jgi:integrase
MKHSYGRRSEFAEFAAEHADGLVSELIRFAAYTGLRQGELVVLQWSDINFAEQTVTVERALSGATISSPKPGKLREVPLGAPASAALRRLEQHARTSPAATTTSSRPSPETVPMLRRHVGVTTKHGMQRELPPQRSVVCDAPLHPSSFARWIRLRSRRSWAMRASRTTERYLHARRASDMADKATDALSSAMRTDEDRFAEQLLKLDSHVGSRLLDRAASHP